MMTLKEAIKHAKEMSGNQYVCEECKNEQKQLAEWLEELDLLKTKGKWIPCNKQMPDERKSMFAKWKGTDKWEEGMFEKISNNVYITVECRLGDRVMAIAHAVDGKWRSELLNIYPDAKVIAWFPAPELYKGECET